jgi:hypothetical protein
MSPAQACTKAIDRRGVMALEKELETYNKKFTELKAQHEGKFVLIHGDQIVDTFETYEDAIKRGYQEFKSEPFLVKQIHTIEPVFFLSRNATRLTHPV